MSRTPNYDAKVKAILDSTRPGERTCALMGEKWMMTEEEIGWYKKFNVPPSDLAPRTRWGILMHFGTGYQWWWNTHWKTGKPVLTFHHPSAGCKTLPDAEWLQEDFSKQTLVYQPDQSFFGQFFEFSRRFPLPSSNNKVQPENSISFASQGDKNSFFTLGSSAKNSLYCIMAKNTEDTSVCYVASEVFGSHNIVHCERMHRCQFSRECHDCIDSDFLFDCRHCDHCFGATNKRNKKYIWMNRQCSQSEWEAKRVQIDLGRRDIRDIMLGEFERLLVSEAVWPENFNEKTEQSIGDYLTNCTNCRYCFNMSGPATQNFWVCVGIGSVEGCAFTAAASASKDCYLSHTPGSSANLKFCVRLIGCDTCEYSLFCQHCEYCFGCVGLQHKRFHIFNQPYDEESYWKKLDEIKCGMLSTGEYGQPIPMRFATGYVEFSSAKQIVNYSPDELKKMGAQDFVACSSGACGLEEGGEARLKKAEDIPNNIDDVSEEWLNTKVYDPEVKRQFTLFKPEVALSKQYRIAPPTEHFSSRVRRLWDVSQTAVFEQKSCADCGLSLLASHNPQYTNRRVLCRSCYATYLEKQG